MVIFHDPACVKYGSSMRPEQPARAQKSVLHLQTAHPGWEWRHPRLAEVGELRLAHSDHLLKRLQRPLDFDSDTPYFPGIFEHASRSVGAALGAAEYARSDRRPAFSLMRPPGHHATADQAMGFCYLNQVAVAALHLRAQGLARVAIWDFDAHHGNGTESLVIGQRGLRFVSVHQSPGYPGTGTENADNCFNFPVRPHASREEHMGLLRESWDQICAFDPELILVSAGFDAYARDPITAMTLEREDFATLGSWLRGAPSPCAAILEGGYSDDLPHLIDSFLTAWSDPV